MLLIDNKQEQDKAFFTLVVNDLFETMGMANTFWRQIS